MYADPFHSVCLELLEGYPGTLIVPALVVAEVAQTLEDGFSERLFLDDLAAGELLVEAPTHDDWSRASQLVARYADLPLGAVDATVVAAAERLNLTTIATLDRRHFSVIRPLHAEAFELVP